MTLSIAEPSSRTRLTDQDWQVSNTTTTLPDRATLTGSPPGRRKLRFPFKGGEFVVEIPDDPPTWVEPTAQSLGELLQLEPGWDSYGARPVDPYCAAAALHLAFNMLADSTPAPSVVPTSRGGLQFEWHTRSADLEVEFLSATRVLGLFEDRVSGSGWEKDLTFEVQPLVDAISQLSQRR